MGLHVICCIYICETLSGSVALAHIILGSAHLHMTPANTINLNIFLKDVFISPDTFKENIINHVVLSSSFSLTCLVVCGHSNLKVPQ